MYEAMTYDAILATAMAEVSDDVQKGEGSLVYNALSVLAFEVEKAYTQLDYVIEQSHADTADLENLILIASDRAIEREAATNAIVSITANIALPIGWRGSLKGYNYTVTALINAGTHTYRAHCEEAGSGPNTMLGGLTAIDYVEGLTTATITEVLVLGEDDETQESLLARYKASFGIEAFGGNIADYKDNVNAFSGVGGCKVYPVWNGVGTVKVVVISSDYGACSQYLIDEIQEAAQPTGGDSGSGFAPIDHTVTIASVTETTVDITTTITYTTGYSWSTIGSEIEAAISAYFLSLATSWSDGEDDDFITVYVSRVESAILSVTGVTDVTGTTLNGSAANLALATDAVPVLGEVTAS